MRYFTFVKMDPKIGDAPQALMDAMGVWVQDSIEKGIFLDGGGIYAQTYRTEFTVRGDEVTTFDGPFTEGRETVGGYAVLECRDHDEALAHARKFIEMHQQLWPGWEGGVEVRRIAEPDETGGK